MNSAAQLSLILYSICSIFLWLLRGSLVEKEFGIIRFTNLYAHL